NLILIFLLDFFFSTGYNQFEMLSPLIVVSFIATALLKVRFANIFYILKKSTIYAIFLFIFIFSYIAAAAYLFNFFQIINNIYATYYMAIFFVIFAIIFRPIVDFIRNFIDQHIFKTAFNYKMIVESFSQKISNFVDFTDVITAISTLFNETFKPAAIYFQGIAEKPAFALDDLDEVKKYLIKIFESASPSSIIDPIFVEYLSPETISEQSYDFFLKSGISIIIPVYQQDSLFGFYFLGNKFMKDAYNDDDIQLINTILNQAKVALNNAGMYKNLVEANKRLEETIIKLENTQLELAKKEKFAALGRLSANIAHEVKNPLGIMKISASSLSDALSEKPKLKEVANFINKEIDKLNNFVSELLDFARDREIQSVPSDISNLLNELVERGNLYAKSEGKNVAIILSMPASKITVMADPDQLSRALLNIVINAIDSISKEKEGKIEIGLSEKKDQTVEITITDNGCGIDESQIKKGIEPFFTTKKKGTGLGLVVTQQIVEKHGGKLAISSKINEGTKLGVYLPKKTA
ncbi:MAG TPA: ATP-binding protein, partial [Candidatus Wallbacteria bacterium]|nr:ATP-binding protein [Candidatus Wallbacteria bacterium]